MNNAAPVITPPVWNQTVEEPHKSIREVQMQSPSVIYVGNAALSWPAS